MMRDKASREPKPFFLIALSKEAPQKGAPPAHDRFYDWSGRLELEIEVVSEYLYAGSGRLKLEIEVVSEYLYAGSGNLELFNLESREQAYYAFARSNGQLVIPGTGIKGAVRSIAEAISNSCVRQIAKGERASGHEGCRDKDVLCPACRLFGATGYGGRVHFSDAVPVEGVGSTIIKIADLWPPRQARGRKFYHAKLFRPLDMRPQRSHRFIEVVPKGSKFTATIYFENVSTAEMGLLIRALGLSLGPQDEVVHVFPVKLGGAKPRCLGAAYLKPRQLYLIPSSPDIFSALIGGGRLAPVSDNLKTWLQDDSLLDWRAWERLLEEAKPKPEFCPREVY